MGLSVYGETALSIEDPGEITTDRFGLETASVTWKKELGDESRADFYAGTIPQNGDPHPYAQHLKLVRRKILWRPGIVMMPCDYEGVAAQTEPVYSLEIGLSEEPIETHRLFPVFAGKPSDPRNGAIFDADGRFVGFSGELVGSLGNTTPNWPWGGTTAYLDFSKAVWTSTYYTPEESYEYLDVLGKINEPPGNPPLYNNRNWLYMGVSREQRGGAMQIKNQWMLSGRGGWNGAIYGYDDTQWDE